MSYDSRNPKLSYLCTMKNHLLFFWCFLVFPLFAQTGDSSLLLSKEAEAAYAADEYERALDIWRKLYVDGYYSPAMSYDMGLAAYRLGDFPLALAYAKTALKHDPLQENARQLAALVRQHLDMPEPPEEFAPLHWWHIFYTRLSANAWAVIALLLAWLIALYGWFLHKYTKGKWNNRLLLPLIFAVFLFALSLGAAYSMASRMQPFSALVALQTTPLHVGADEDSPVLEELPPGAELRYLDHIGDWYKIVSPTGQSGWVMRKEADPFALK